MNLYERRSAALTAARQIADHAKTAGRFTDSEQQQFEQHLAEADQLETQIKAAVRDQNMIARIATLNPTPGESHGFLSLHPKAMAAEYLKQQTGAVHSMTGDPTTKSLIGDGSGIVAVPLTPSSPVTQGKPAQTLLDVIPALQTSREFAYLRQTTRTNNAAFVAPGALKPTSVYSLTRIEDKLRVLAHLSEPVDRFWLEDNTALQQFVADELFFGLRAKLENVLVNGDGVGETPAGFNATSGIQTQAFATNPILTARAALTKLELIFGDATGYFVFHPNDWEKIETQTLSGGAYVFAEAGAAAPIDRVQRRLWGLPVALTLAQTPGSGWLVSSDAAVLYTDTQGVRIDWSTSGDDFSRNQLRARCEGRFSLAVQKPLGLVKMALTGS